MFMNQKVLGRGLVGAAPVVLGAALANTRARIAAATFCNTDTVARSINVWLVPTGGSPSASNQIHKDYGLAAGESFTSPHLNHVLNDGDTIMASADAGDVVSFYITAVEMSKAG